MKLDKTNAHRLYILGISLFVIMVNLSCNRGVGGDCGPTQSSRYDLTQGEVKKMPYSSGYESLTFISDQNDTVTLVGQGKNVSYEKENISGSNPDCPPPISEHQVISINFNSDKPSLLSNVSITLYQDYKDNSPYGYPPLMVISFMSTKVKWALRFLDTKYYTDTASTCSGGKESVVKLTDDNGISMAFYNETKGIIQLNDNKCWRLCD